jgi:prepilin-type N-terminal cleavage/methylation domain-containing protein
MARPISIRTRSGLSLLEMLVTIAVLGIMTAIAVLVLAKGHYTDSREAVARRNAQQSVSMVLMAEAAGADATEGTVMATLRRLKTGVTASGGAFDQQVFRLSGVSEKDMERAAYYLDIQGGQLVYLANKATNTANW